MNDATNASAGSATSSLGVPVCRSRPSTITLDPLRERRRVLEVVRDEQDRDVEPGEQVVELGADRRLRVRVERRERLVEQQHLRVARERARERDALPLAAGELARPRVREVRDAKALEVVVRRVPARVLDVLANGHVREERVLLEDEPDAPRAPAAARARCAVEPHVVVDGDASRSAAASARRRCAGPSSCPRRTARRARRVAPTSSVSSELERPKRDGDLVESERCHESPMWRPARRTMLIRTSTPLIASVASKFDGRTRRRSRAAASA